MILAMLHLETLGVGIFFLLSPILVILSLFPKYFSLNVLEAFFSKNIWFTLLFTMLCIGMIRGNYESSSANVASAIAQKVISFSLFISIVVCIAHYQLKYLRLDFYKSLYYLLLLPSTCYFGLNLITHLLGIRIRNGGLEDQSIDPAIMLSKVGVDINRVQFPLATGLNNYSFSVSLIFLVLLFFVFVLKRHNLFCWASLLLCIISLLLIDTRVALFLPIILVFLAVRFRGTFKYSKVLFLLFFFFGPLIYIFVVPYFSEILGLDTIARSEDDLQSGNFRIVIWGISLEFFSEFQLEHIFGYGEYGHFGSGQSANWSFAFTNIQNSSINTTAHSSLITILYDYGYFGLVVFVAFFLKLFNVIRFSGKTGNSYGLLLMSVLLFVSWGGSTDTLLGFYFENFLSLFLVFIIVYLTHFNNDNANKFNVTNTNSKFSDLNKVT
jgi:O-antigen ligase